MAPGLLRMPRMLKELSSKPESGFLGHVSFAPIVQYWRSTTSSASRATTMRRIGPWVDFNKKIRVSSGDVGIWHEIYLVRAGQFEAIYGSMPGFGLANAGRHVAVTGGRDAARERLPVTESAA
jgi:fumigallin biosynthesis monooxygenase-like protein